MSFQSKNFYVLVKWLLNCLIIQKISNLIIRELNIKKIFLHRKCIKNFCWAAATYDLLTYYCETLIDFCGKGIFCGFIMANLFRNTVDENTCFNHIQERMEGSIMKTLLVLQFFKLQTWFKRHIWFLFLFESFRFYYYYKFWNLI